MILLMVARRLIKGRHYRDRDALRLRWAQQLDGALESPDITLCPSGDSDRAALEEVILLRLNSADGPLRERLTQLFESAGLRAWRIGQLLAQPGSRSSEAAYVLGRVRCTEATSIILQVLARAPAEDRPLYLAALESIGGPPAVRSLFELVSASCSSASQLYIAALRCCARDCPGWVLPYLFHDREHVRIVAASVLSYIAVPSLTDSLVRASRDASAEVRAKVAKALARCHHPLTVDALRRLSRDEIWFVRLHAVASLGKIAGSDAASRNLIAALADPEWQVQEKAAVALFGCCDYAELVRSAAERGEAALDTVVSAWERNSRIWDTLSLLRSTLLSERRKALRFIFALLKANKSAAIVAARVLHPDSAVREALRSLVVGYVEQRAGAVSATFARAAVLGG